MDDVPTAELTTDAMTDKTGGWCAPSGIDYGQGIAMSVPVLSIRRGGIWFARFTVHTYVRKAGFREFYVNIRPHGRAGFDEIGPFSRRKHAESAKVRIDAAVRALQGLYENREQ